MMRMNSVLASTIPRATDGYQVLGRGQLFRRTWRAVPIWFPAASGAACLISSSVKVLPASLGSCPLYSTERPRSFEPFKLTADDLFHVSQMKQRRMRNMTSRRPVVT